MRANVYHDFRRLPGRISGIWPWLRPLQAFPKTGTYQEHPCHTSRLCHLRHIFVRPAAIRRGSPAASANQVTTSVC